MNACMRAALVVACLHVSSIVAAQPFDQPLPEEPLPSVIELPAVFPASWLLVHDFNFNSITDGRGAVVDVADPVNALKGHVQVPHFGNILVSGREQVFYTAETYYSRFTRGDRTDVITKWDRRTLKPIGEIILPGGKRLQQLTYKNTFQFTNDEKWALIANFTPAQSVSVVDLEGGKVLADIDLPGCSLIYPTGARGFASFCSDGTMISVVLGPDGKLASSTNSRKFQDIDNQPLYPVPAMIGRTGWFLSYKGLLQPIDFSGSAAKLLPGAFSVGTAPGAAPEWRPGGWQVVTSDQSGKLYVLMNPAGREGSHKDGGTEVWVFDPVAKHHISRIPLQGTGYSIEVTREATPRLVVARVDSVIDVYDAATGAFQHSLGTRTAFNPQTLSVIPQ